MTLPAVNLNELDGALGILPPSSGKLAAFVGAASSGPFATPATFGRTKDIITNFVDGPVVEAACSHVLLTGKPAIIVRSAQSVPAAAGAVDSSGKTGTSAVTTTGTAQHDDYEVVFKVINGGTIGVAGITFAWSLDGGNNFSPSAALGTANTFTIPGSGVVLAFGAGTLVVGDQVTFRTTAPQWNASDLTAALTALGNTAAIWEICEIVGAVDGTAFDAIETAFTAMRAAGKRRAWVANTRIPALAESEATYLGSLSTAFVSKTTKQGSMCAGSCRMTSAVSGRYYQRPVSYIYALREASSSAEVNQADINLGSLPVAIADANGNPLFHDEAINPGLDDARFVTLRTIPGEEGVYFTRPRIFSASGSDYDIMPKRRVMNIAEDALYAYLIRRLNKPIQVDSATGFILEHVALEIEDGAEAAVKAALMAVPMASDVTVAVSRTDNILSTKTLSGDLRVVPLAYPEMINFTTGFTNPALALQA